MQIGMLDNVEETLALAIMDNTSHPLLVARDISNEQEHPSKRRRIGEKQNAMPHAGSGLGEEVDVTDASLLRADEQSTAEDPAKLTSPIVQDPSPVHQSVHASGSIHTRETLQQHQWPIPCPCELFPVLFQAELEFQHEIISYMCVHEFDKPVLWKTKQVGQNSYVCYATKEN